jgi:hypothetical protein
MGDFLTFMNNNPLYYYYEKGKKMKRLIKIMHIDPEYKITYFIKRPGSFIRSQLSLEKAINLLKTEKIDLILSEPDNKAILTPQSPMDCLLQAY